MIVSLGPFDVDALVSKDLLCFICSHVEVSVISCVVISDADHTYLINGIGCFSAFASLRGSAACCEAEYHGNDQQNC